MLKKINKKKQIVYVSDHSVDARSYTEDRSFSTISTNLSENVKMRTSTIVSLHKNTESKF